MLDAARGGRNAAALAILALCALLLTPFLFQRAIAKHRAFYSATLDPARGAASEGLLALSREVGAIRGYLLTEDTSLLREYRAARLEQDQALSRLESLSHADSAMEAQARVFDAAAKDWNASNDLLANRRITVAEATARLSDQQDKYSAALDAGQALDRSVVRAVDGIRVKVGALEHWWAMATIGLAILAAAGAVLVVLIMRTSYRESELARTDPLTGLYNRLGFDELAARELNRARRHASPITLMSFDLDGFKQINDQRGHAAGDAVLRAVGRSIRRTVREVDVGARLGGDEFAVLLPDNRATPPERAVERVRGAIMDALAREGWPVTMSIGAVTVRQSDIAVDEMIRVADKLMYSVKNQGKNSLKHELHESAPVG
jgi:diguanylate cyclase (GGDEF)-like protein